MQETIVAPEDSERSCRSFTEESVTNYVCHSVQECDSQTLKEHSFETCQDIGDNLNKYIKKIISLLIFIHQISYKFIYCMNCLSMDGNEKVVCKIIDLKIPLVVQI